MVAFKMVTYRKTSNIRCTKTGLDIKHLVYMPVGRMVLKSYVPCKNFDVPSQYLYKPCKAYVYCWENKYMPRLKNPLSSRARSHKISCALGQDLHTPGMRARLNVEPYLIPKLKRFSSRLTVISAQSIEARCYIEKWEWRCSWSSADSQCSNYMWVINNFIAY